jgi:hypothetical protein
MDKDRVAGALEEIAVLLEVQGENPFKSRAYANAARALRAEARDLDDLVREGGLLGMPGIGPTPTEKITTLARTGRLPYLDLEEVLRVAAGEAVCVELNANPHRLDLDTEACGRARALGARLAIDPDSHEAQGLADARFGVAVARQAGLSVDGILNTLPADRLETEFRARRDRARA